MRQKKSTSLQAGVLGLSCNGKKIFFVATENVSADNAPFLGRVGRALPVSTMTSI